MRHDVEELERAAPSRSEMELAQAVSLVDRGIENYVERCRKRIPSFVADNFSLEQAWTLQRPTLWRDLACSPINAAWALPQLAVHKAAETAEKVGASHAARAKRLPTGIKTGYQRQIEQRICRDLLEWDREASPARLPQGFLSELDADPPLRKRIETLDQRVPGRALTDLLNQFSSGRAVVSDLMGTILTLVMSWLILGSASLSLNNLAHGLARKSAHDRAASRFFLGKKAGSAFYNIFPPSVDESTVWTTFIVLGAFLAIAAMACAILSDPVRKALGFHRRRLEVLIDDVERELIVLSHKRLREDLRGCPVAPAASRVPELAGHPAGGPEATPRRAGEPIRPKTTDRARAARRPS